MLTMRISEHLLRSSDNDDNDDDERRQSTHRLLDQPDICHQYGAKCSSPWNVVVAAWPLSTAFSLFPPEHPKIVCVSVLTDYARQELDQGVFERSCKKKEGGLRIVSLFLPPFSRVFETDQLGRFQLSAVLHDRKYRTV